MSIEVMRELAALRAIEPQWTSLHERIETAGLFSSPAWVLNWLEAFASAGSLLAVAVRRGDELIAVLPFVRVETRWRRVPVRALAACTNSHSVRSALLFCADHRAAAASALTEVLRGERGWDLVLLDGCEPQALPLLGREMAPQRWSHSSLDVHGRWDDYLHSRPRDLRRNLRRTEDALARRGHARFTEVDAAEPLFDLWTEVDRASWKATRGETVDADAATARYHRGLLDRLARASLLRGGVLWLDERPIAVLVSALHRGVFYTLKAAQRDDLSSARVSLGALTMARVLRSVWERGDVRTIDFVARQDYTERWSRDERYFERRGLLGPTWRGALVGWLDAAAHRAARTAPASPPAAAVPSPPSSSGLGG